jgi:hypothetical protein
VWSWREEKLYLPQILKPPPTSRKSLSTQPRPQLFPPPPSLLLTAPAHLPHIQQAPFLPFLPLSLSLSLFKKISKREREETKSFSESKVSSPSSSLSKTKRVFLFSLQNFSSLSLGENPLLSPLTHSRSLCLIRLEPKKRRESVQKNIKLNGSEKDSERERKEEPKKRRKKEKEKKEEEEKSLSTRSSSLPLSPPPPLSLLLSSSSSPARRSCPPCSRAGPPRCSEASSSASRRGAQRA